MNHAINAVTFQEKLTKIEYVGSDLGKTCKYNLQLKAGLAFTLCHVAQVHNLNDKHL